MAIDDRLGDLLVEWEQGRRAGHEPSLDELCKDVPELLPAMRESVNSVKATDWMFEKEPEADSADELGSLPCVALEDTDLPASHLTVQEFATSIFQSGLLSPAEIEELKDRLAASALSGEAREVASKLVMEGKLTRYQASVLLKASKDPLLVDNYVILDTLDTGGMGLVFKALHRSMNRIVALKLLPSSMMSARDTVKRFQREVQAAAVLKHPNVVAAYDAGESAEIAYLVLEYVEGTNLYRLVKERGPLRVAEAADYVRQAAMGLAYLHSRGIIHRDVKPGNLILANDGTVKLLDMGLVRFASSEDLSCAAMDQQLTQAGIVIGTVAYMSPEQALDTRSADQRSDIYSLGCTLFFLLTGRSLYHEDTGMKTLLAHREQAVPSIREFCEEAPVSLDAVFRTMVAKRPADRPQTMEEVIAAIDACVPGLSAAKVPSAPRPTGLHGLSRKTRRSRITRIAIAIGGLALIVAVCVAVIVVRIKTSTGSTRIEVADPKSIVTVETRPNEPAARTSPDRVEKPIKIRPDTTPTASLPYLQAPELLVAPFDENNARAARRAWAKYQQVDEETKNSLGMELVLIPGGRFLMGSPKTTEELVRVFPYLKDFGAAHIPQDQRDVSSNDVSVGERPLHRVTISRPFYLGKYEVTKGQFKKFVEATGYRTDAEMDGKGGWGYTADNEKPFEQRPSFNWRDWGVDQSDRSPVVNVSHHDAVAFCEYLSKMEDKKYRLPTEAEWEYACRAGTAGRYYNGDDPEGLTSIANVWDRTGKEKTPTAFNNVNSSDGCAFTGPVGQFRPNNFGLYDMIGNAWEWCSDWYDKDYYSNSPERDPTGARSGFYRVYRGGGWRSFAVFCRSAHRAWNLEAYRHAEIGFRLARSAAPVQAEDQLPAGSPEADSGGHRFPVPQSGPLPPSSGRGKTFARVEVDYDRTFSGSRVGQTRKAMGLNTTLVWIPPGDFTMGSPKYEKGRHNNEDQVQVTLTNGFWLGQHEVTQAEWQRVMQTAPWSGKLYVKEGDDYPATFVSWDDAMTFCKKLTEQEYSAGRLAIGWRYTLPTEAQWEYACRCGTKSQFSFGDDESDLGEHAWFDKNASDAGEKYAHAVGQKKANWWTISDMHGNVMEWCRDWYGKQLAFGTDPQGPSKGSDRVARGGSWVNIAGKCRSAFRDRYTPDHRLTSLGFRVAAVPSDR